MNLEKAIERAKAMSEVAKMLRALEFLNSNDNTTILELSVQYDYMLIKNPDNINTKVLANCLDSLKIWGYPKRTTLYELEFDIEALKDKIERFKEDRNIRQSTMNLNEFEITTEFN